MTHADIVAWWAVGIAILALVAHIPLSMLAHHYLPKFEDYLASHSREKLTKRIAKLRRRLAQLNDPKYFEELEWKFREHLFLTLYLFGTGFLAQSGTLFLSTGAVGKNWLWQPRANWPLGSHIPEVAIVFFSLGVFVAGRNMFRSSSLKPSRRPKLRSDIQAQIDALGAKLDEFRAP
jgi:hypothetical protein